MSEIDERGELVVAFDASVEDEAPRELSFAEKADLILASSFEVLDNDIERIWERDPATGNALYEVRDRLRRLGFKMMLTCK
jgi:hypothetical protein